MKLTEVVIALIIKEDKFLFGKRSVNKSHEAGYWVPVGGRIKDGETQENALIRECCEEIGVEIQPLKFLKSFSFKEKQLKQYWWLVDIVSGMPRICNDEHTDLQWFTYEQIRDLSPKLNITDEAIQLVLK